MKTIYCKEHPDTLKEIREELLAGSSVEVNNQYETIYGVGFDQWLRENIKDIPCSIKVTSMSSQEGLPWTYLITPNSAFKQFLEFKRKFPESVLLFRCGDSYESYGEDADTISNIIGIATMSNGEFRIASFPHYSLDTYLPKLIRAGRRVAICDQLEDPKLNKNLVKSSSESLKKLLAQRDGHIPLVSHYTELLDMAVSLFHITKDEAREKYGKFTYAQWAELMENV